MANCMSVLRVFTARLQECFGIKTSPSTTEKQPLQISAPFNFKHETISLPGVSEDEIAVLKERAVTRLYPSSIGTPRKAPTPPTPNYPDPSFFSTPRKAPTPPTLAPIPVLKVTPSTPVSPPISPAGNRV
ncbi:hypothetical protein F4820DRAFT_170866 [Hypoxylon rubiginosum]|uniref:Uncharacterized protein n=1 Tax=Hypoxylon rubiginosum TaxID=110542 RepID=A0ACB9Z923_9PEZI|nr:hypothetical protein F4820DRAFT_170866 [Hypoxylon rubiginosum]